VLPRRRMVRQSRPLLFANPSSMISLSRFCNLVDRDFAEVLSREAAYQPAFIDTKDFTFAQDHGSFDDVLQFTDVAGPAVVANNFKVCLPTFVIFLPSLLA